MSEVSKQNNASSHPLDGLDEGTLHTWMREECASYSTARQAREDSLIATIAQISSAVVLGLPALLLNSTYRLELTRGTTLLALGLVAFFIALASSLTEQFLSAKANDKQWQLSVDYYNKKTEDRIDKRAWSHVRWAQTVALISFAAAALLSVFGLIFTKSEIDGKTSQSLTAYSAAIPKQ